ncbi:putative translational activator Gcn1 [Helianthus annuus]|nr:putative translational activator Gcn1 [Helianthus annuus]
MSDAFTAIPAASLRNLGDKLYENRKNVALKVLDDCVMGFGKNTALETDTNAVVRGRMINAGIMIIDRHGKDNVSLLFPLFENYLNRKASDEEKYDLVREGVVIFTGALAKHLSQV